ncbi:MAG: HEAT repeat domain-containing protein [Nostocaceae cyanobacterium]|nr:HEAT repeat domain-containing protein [Nostocaceae cyanobacterium]
MDFSDYLRSLCHHYAKWWKPYAFIDEINNSTWFEFELTSKTQEKPKQPGQKPTENTQPVPVLKAIREYAHEKILIVGSPGMGKSTLLARVMSDAAQQALNNPEFPIPVLVELKLYRESGIWVLMQTALETHNLYLDIPDIKRLVADKRLLLLADGLNELPTEPAKYEFQKFCQRQIPIIVTTRDFAGDVRIERKLQLQNLDSLKVKAFFQSRLPGQEQKQIQQLCDRVKDFGQTPLMVWMLFSVFQQKGEIPATRGEAYRTFTTLYVEKAKQGIDLDESRSCLSKLAFAMMQAQQRTDFRLEIGEFEAQDLLGAKTLKHLLRNHLLQSTGKPGDRQIRFCHQSLQEYYAAEWLLSELRQHPEWLKKKPEQKYTWFQQQYLNLLKWTESLAIMLSLMEDNDNASRVVEQALDVDLILGARLAGVVKLDFQENTVRLVSQCKLPDGQNMPGWLEVRLLGKTGSAEAIPFLKDIFNSHPKQVIINSFKPEVRERASVELLLLGYTNHLENSQSFFDLKSFEPDTATTTFTDSKSENQFKNIIVNTLSHLRKNTKCYLKYLYSASKAVSSGNIPLLFKLLKHKNKYLKMGAIHALEAIGSEEIVPGLLQVVEYSDSLMGSSAAGILGRLKFNSAIPRLIQLIEQHPNREVRSSAVYALSLIGSEEVIPGLSRAVEDSDFWVAKSALEGLGRIDSEKVTPAILTGILHPHPYVSLTAAAILRKISVKESAEELLRTETAVTLLLKMLESPQSSMRWHITFILWNICHEELITILRKKLNYHHPNFDITENISLLLGKLGCEEAVSGLIHAIKNPDFEVRHCAVYALGKVLENKKVSTDKTAEYLPDLLPLLTTGKGEEIIDAIAAIQNCCQFYNFQLLPVLEPASQAEKTTNIFNIETLNAKNSALNLGGTIYGNQIANQNHKSEL